MKVAGLLAVVVIGWFLWQWRDYRDYVEQAERFQAVGFYEQAEQHYLQALKVFAAGHAARFGAEKTAFARKMMKIHDVAQYEVGQELNALLRREPDDTLLILLDGDRYYRQGDHERAALRYRHAVELDPELAEGYFRLGVLSDQTGDATSAEAYYRRAADSGQDNPAYGNNLAYLFLKAGRYEDALREYGRLEQYPLAALEAAKVLWALGRLDEAADRQRQAIRWLEEPTVANLPPNQGPWYFEIPQARQGVRLTAPGDKLCYARLALAATWILQGREDELKQSSSAANCPELPAELKQVLSADLRRYAESHPELVEKSRAFRRRYLADAG
jgi:tetratricopeptide (TPR) repeat protein